MFRPIQTERLKFRNFVATDTPVLFTYRSHPDVARYQDWAPQSLHETARFIEDQQDVMMNTPGTWRQLGIALKNDNRLIGDCGIHFPSITPFQVEFGISLDPHYQGQGYATEALKGLFSFLFKDLGKHRIYGSADPRNTASTTLMERLGMRKEAHFVESYRFKGTWADDVIYAMLAREFVS